MSIPYLNLKPLTPANLQGGPAKTRLPADLGLYPTAAYKVGNDVFVPLAVATAFGGPFDRGDDGRTASGVLTSRPGGVIGVALPMPRARGCRGTPFAQFPWNTPVHVSCKGNTVVMPVIDEGPTGGLKSRAFIDITVEGWEALLDKKLSEQEVNSMEQLVSFTIPGGVPLLAGYWPYGVPRGAEGEGVGIA